MLFLIATLLGGLSGLLAYRETASPSIQALGPVFGYILYAGLFVGATVALFGVFLPGERGSVFERAGLFLLSSMLVGFSLAVMIRSGTDATSVVLWAWAWAGAGLWRCQQIGKEIDEQQAARALLSSRRQER